MNSAETRGHLADAHQRVMSVAAVQRQFAATIGDDIPLRSYFTDLCQSIHASMVRDYDTLTLAVTVDESLANANVSVSLGLIVTELVINALKYAFPHGRGGRIEVDYQRTGEGWTLTVTDDGVGKPIDPAATEPGLATSIVEALAKHLKASVQIAGAHPGTAVSITHH
jgi:two-component sensor histidine kinase